MSFPEAAPETSKGGGLWGFRVLGVRVLGFLGFGGLGFLGFRALGFGVYPLQRPQRTLKGTLITTHETSNLKGGV